MVLFGQKFNHKILVIYKLNFIEFYLSVGTYLKHRANITQKKHVESNSFANGVSNGIRINNETGVEPW